MGRCIFHIHHHCLQRLLPYPRILLRRTAANFKDYNKAPIGFGIAVFCLAPKATARCGGSLCVGGSGRMRVGERRVCVEL